MDSSQVVCGVHILCRSAGSKVVKWAPSFNVSYRQYLSAVAVVCARFVDQTQYVSAGDPLLASQRFLWRQEQEPWTFVKVSFAERVGLVIRWRGN